MSSYSNSSSEISKYCCIKGNKVEVSKDSFIIFNEVAFTNANAIEVRIGAKNNDEVLNS